MNMRELVGTSLNSGTLEMRDHAEMPVDRVAALAKASDLGRALFHWAYAGDKTSARSAFNQLCRKARNRTRIFRHHQDYKLLERVCLMVLHEWRHPACHACGGVGEVENAKLRVVCQVCSGTGLHRYADHWRIEFLKIEEYVYRKWERYIAAVTACITAEDIAAVRTCRAQLERAA